MKKWYCCLAVFLCFLWGCASDDVATIAPAPLPAVNEEISLRVLWSENTGSGLGETFTRIKPAIVDNTIFVASVDGAVSAYDRMTGDQRWAVNIETAISGGIGAGENKVFVATLNGKLVALNAEDGSTTWTTELTSEVLSAPQVDGGIVVVQSNDDIVAALNISDGSQRWVYNDTAPPLTIRGTASPLIFAGATVVGLSNGRVAVLNNETGNVLWDRAVSVGEGRTELDRLNDVDGSPAMHQGSLFAGNYQGHLVAFDARTSEIKWQNDLSTLVTPVVDDSNVYVTNSESHVLAFDQSSGSPVWSVADLHHRSLTAPEIFGEYIVVADFEGYVHVLASSDGRFVGRERADSDGVRVQPVVVDDTLYVYGNSGKLTAYQLSK